MSLLKILATYRFSRYFKLGFLVWDLVLLNTSIAISFLLLYGNFQMIDIKGNKALSFLSNVFWISLLLYKDSFRIVRTERIEAILYRTIRMLMIHLAVIALFIVVLDYDEISRLRMVYFYSTFFLLLISFRILFMKMLKYVRSRGFNFRKVVIVGANATGERMNRILSKDLTYGYRVMGFFDDETDSETELKAPVLGRFEDVEDYLNSQKIDEMYVALHISKIKVINKLTALCERYMVRIKYIPDFQQYTKSNRVEISFYGNGNVPVLMLRKEPLEIPLHRITKKIFDFCFSLFVIVFVFSWLFPILIILIKLNSPGPVFFVQERSGRDNKSFPCFKFRTMYVNDVADKVQASLNDARITKVGAFLRRTSLDELPQFFNVLLGNMSVVGPRPHMLSHTEQYSELINNFLVRHYAKPGITGWAQVNGYRGETKELADMEGRVEHDIWYIENWSLLLDVKIVWNTFVKVFQGDKNAF
ncbi:undecaprenyl-phosphate galactose phosphotransferase/putative colanic acid biosysnthesis UDP-glucose lipid carrier transferase [Flavobacterium fluvii]|uniref:Undecaprenyl-phosphate galactose phosphotransferase/putative colanic acid biosysnthesis UDP-glucose lipid carrier transferase n=1 Tax=Flavobacterium fluvii TaxID=468056 RepID=A0A1M5ILB3_9FLAO|nr:undecaprenyl-phosphate glucose phosphotransferase [Flavobacterium fluvii]SHG29016.1 undecaprenyl-phosphate galactose phosphotransferase/putative colanic acid biosysnthesis UDP-glucose lipid carrier transferase [Flavobacterium fluvii]